MRFRLTMLAAITAVALSSAPAHASPLLPCDFQCSTLLPGYWENPIQPICESLLAISCGWY
jgi:hypothetical protein